MIIWCCMCKMAGETLDHLFLYYIAAQEPRCIIFSLLRVYWVMPKVSWSCKRVGKTYMEGVVTVKTG